MKKGRGPSAADPPPSSSSSKVEAEEDGELHAVKAEKLRQHKLQESNRNQHMLAAKNRAKVQLQKRLEELAAKKKVRALVHLACRGSPLLFYRNCCSGRR